MSEETLEQINLEQVAGEVVALAVPKKLSDHPNKPNTSNLSKRKNRNNRSSESELVTRDIDHAVQGDLRVVLEELFSHSANLEQRIDQIESDSSLSIHRFAREAYQIVRMLVRDEAQLYAFKDGLGLLEHRLCAEPYIIEIFQSLVARLNPLVYQSGSKQLISDSSLLAREPELDRFKIVAALRELVDWYSKRKMSLIRLKASQATQKRSADPEQDQIFGLSLVHDRAKSSVQGCELSSSIFLQGHRLEQLWLKVFVRSKGQYVKARADWQLWMDDTDRLELTHIEGETRFAAILPLLPDRQRVLIDAARVFVPYEALDLAQGCHKVEFEIGIYEQSGKLLVGDKIVDTISLSHPNQRVRAIPSPQALGLWNEDLIAGHSISELRVSEHKRSATINQSNLADASSNKTQQILKLLRIETDLDLKREVARDGSLAREQNIDIECRIIDPAGLMVVSNDERYRDQDGNFIISMSLTLTSSVTKLYGLCLEAPIQAINLEPGLHDLYVEMTILGRERKVLCGTIGKVQLGIDGALTDQASEQQYLVERLPDGVRVSVAQDSFHQFLPQETSEFSLATKVSAELSAKAKIEENGLVIDYVIALKSGSVRDCLLQIELIGSNNQVLKDRSSSAASYEHDSIHDISTLGQLSFQRLVSARNSQSQSVIGQLKIATERFMPEQGSLDFTVCLFLMDRSGEEVAFRSIELSVSHPVPLWKKLVSEVLGL